MRRGKSRGTGSDDTRDQTGVDGPVIITRFFRSGPARRLSFQSPVVRTFLSLLRQ